MKRPISCISPRSSTASSASSLRTPVLFVSPLRPSSESAASVFRTLERLPTVSPPLSPPAHSILTQEKILRNPPLAPKRPLYYNHYPSSRAAVSAASLDDQDTYGPREPNQREPEHGFASLETEEEKEEYSHPQSFLESSSAQDTICSLPVLDDDSTCLDDENNSHLDDGDDDDVWLSRSLIGPRKRLFLCHRLLFPNPSNESSLWVQESSHEDAAPSFMNEKEMRDEEQIPACSFLSPTSRIPNSSKGGLMRHLFLPNLEEYSHHNHQDQHNDGQQECEEGILLPRVLYRTASSSSLAAVPRATSHSMEN